MCISRRKNHNGQAALRNFANLRLKLYVVQMFTVWLAPVDPADGLGVVARVPARVEDDDSVGAHQVHAEAAGARRHQEQLHLGRGVEAEIFSSNIFQSWIFFCFLTCWSTSPAPSRSCCRPAGSTSPRTPMAPANIFYVKLIQIFLRQNFISGYIFFRFSINNQTLNYLWFVGQGRMCYINTITVNCWQSIAQKCDCITEQIGGMSPGYPIPRSQGRDQFPYWENFAYCKNVPSVTSQWVRSEVIRSPANTKSAENWRIVY